MAGIFRGAFDSDPEQLLKELRALELQKVRDFSDPLWKTIPEQKLLKRKQDAPEIRASFKSAYTDKALLLKFAGTVESGSVAEYGDDGVSQKATVKTGIASKGDAIIPSPARLKPFRTFVEVDQPISSFIFRMKDDRCGGVQCALFEADGGAWKISAMEAIKEYLIKELEGFDNFIVIS